MILSIDIILFIGILTLPSLSYDCVFTPDMWRQNCAQYCLINFSQGPQRAHYNETSKNCQPLRTCHQYSHLEYYHDYSTNQCYNSSENLTILPSRFLYDLTSYHDYGTRNQNINCIHGDDTKVPGGGKAYCQCNLLWTDSNTYDLNGVPFKCDVVTDKVVNYFVGNLTRNSIGDIIKYGKYTADQMKVMIENAKIIQEQETKTYIYAHAQAILFAISNHYPAETIIQQSQYKYLAIALIIGYFIFGCSYIHFKLSKIKLTYSQFKSQLHQIIQLETDFIVDHHQIK